MKVWQLAVEFSTRVHELTRKFPKEELYILTSQMKRAADSVALNIAEGSTGQTNSEFKQFLGYAVRSGIEVVTCLHLAKKRGLIAEREFLPLYGEAQQILKMIQALRNSLD